CDLAISCIHGEEECHCCRGYYWMYQWHCFIQAIADGNTPEAFFAHLTSSQTRSSGQKHQHQGGKEPLHRSFLFLMCEEIRQHAQQICEERRVHRKSLKTWCACLGWRGKGVGVRDVLHG